jgi:UDP-glucose 4-epimerase
MPNKGQYALVLGIFQRLINEGKSLTIVGDGTQRRDFTHVVDVVDANIRAMDYNGNMHGTVFNVGTGKNNSVLELARMIGDNVQFIPPRPAESKETLANNLKIMSQFGWGPTKNIEDYIKENL